MIQKLIFDAESAGGSLRYLAKEDVGSNKLSPDHPSSSSIEHPILFHSTAHLHSFVASTKAQLLVPSNVGSTDARTQFQNVFLLDLRHLEEILTGLVLTNGVTNRNFHQIVEIVLIIRGSYFIQDDDRQTLDRDMKPLLPGNYLLVADGEVTLNDETVLTRTLSVDD